MRLHSLFRESSTQLVPPCPGIGLQILAVLGVAHRIRTKPTFAIRIRARPQSLFMSPTFVGSPRRACKLGRDTTYNTHVI